MHNLLSCKSIMLSVKYTTKYLLSSIKSLVLELFSDAFYLVKIVNCELKISFLQNPYQIDKNSLFKAASTFSKLLHV